MLSSCSVGPAYIPPCVEVPDTWKNKNEKCEKCEVQDPADEADLDYWWEVFEDIKLDELESQAIENNRNLFVSYERIKEARALMGIAASQFYPQLNLNPSYSNIGELIKNYNTSSLTGNAGTAAANLANTVKPQTVFRAHELMYFMPVNMSYEVDLWGKIRDQYAAAKYNWEAQKKDYEVVMLSLTSDLATAYFQLRTLDAQIDLLLNVLKTREKAYEITKDRFEEEVAFYADVTLAAQEISTVLVEYQEVIRQREVLEDQIATLIGVPASEFCLDHMPLKGLPPCIPEGIPSEILLRRPDIAEAEYVTRSDHALVKEAVSLFYPSLTLTSTGGFESPIFKDFLTWLSRYWMLGAQSNQLIFDGFKTPYYLERQIAIFKEATGEYQQQVLVAFQEVEDVLANLDSYGKQYDLSLVRAKWAERTYELYFDRYKSGIIYYIDVANTERDLLNYQIDVNSLQGLRFVSTVQFIKALGGGW